MNVLHLISSSGMYGAESVILQLARAQKKSAGCRPIVGVIVNRGNPHRELADECAASGVETALFPCRGRLDLKTAADLRRFLAGERVAVLHAHGYKANTFARAATLGWTGALVATCHNWPGRSMKMRAYAALDKLLLRGFDRVVAVSDEVMRKIPGSGPGSSRVRVINNGIDSEPFGAAPRARARRTASGAKRGQAVVGYVGRLSNDKGVRVLLDAAQKVRERIPEVRFLLVGDGPQRTEYEARFASSHVVFAGFRREARRCYGCMDVFVLPSFAEGLPMAVLEAMAAGLPVVATKVGQVPELVEEGATGYLIDAGSPDRVADAICRIIQHPEAAARMGERGRELVAKRYSAARMADEYLTAYREALQ